MRHDYDDRDERNRGEFSGSGRIRWDLDRSRARNPQDFFNEHADLGGYYARDTSRAGFGGDYARERMWPEPSYRGRGPKNYRRSDARIAEDVHEMLTDHPGIDATNIDVTVENSEVTLSGTVDTRYEKRVAEDVVANCVGVRDVHNRLQISRRDEQVQIGKASE